MYNEDMSLSPDEKRKIVGFITHWSVKPIFECDILEDSGNKWEEVGIFLEECATALQSWVERDKINPNSENCS